MGERFSQKHEVRYYECDVNSDMTLSMLLRVAIQTSEVQCDCLEIGTNVVKKMGLGWVITQYEIQLTRLPKNEEQIEIITEATSYNKFFCYRDFWIYDSSGQELAYIHTTFVMMNLSTRKMCSIPPQLVEPFKAEKIKKIERSEDWEQVSMTSLSTYQVRFSDIDSNQHVNNAIYIDWMTDVLGYDFLVEHIPKKVSIKFEKEVEYGQTIESKWCLVESHENSDEVLSHHAIMTEDSCCAKAMIVWQKID